MLSHSSIPQIITVIIIIIWKQLDTFSLYFRSLDSFLIVEFGLYINFYNSLYINRGGGINGKLIYLFVWSLLNKIKFLRVIVQRLSAILLFML